MIHHAHKTTSQQNVDSALRKPKEVSRDADADPGRIDVGALHAHGGNQAVSALLGGGVPLEPRLRNDMEARFGADFGGVRIHDDPGAHLAAAGIDAKAYTRGDDIAFGDGRFVPGTRDGRKLLAHELAHVVQQRRGGATPAVDAAAAHERGATAASEQVAAGAASVQVSGGTGVGIARDPDEDQHRKPAPAKQAKAKSTGKANAKASTSGASIYPDSPFKSSLDEDEYNPAIRMLSPGAEYWLNHVADPASLPWTQLVDEANQIGEWLKRQTSTSPEYTRMEQIRDAFQREAESQAKKQGEPAKRPKAAKKGKAKGKGKAAPAALSSEPAVDDRPRALREQSSVDTSDPQVLQQEYDEIIAYLQRKDIPSGDRKALQVELTTLMPQLDQVLGERAQLRHAEEINRAIMPSAGSGDGLEDLKAIAANIDNIKPLSDRPGYSYVTRGSEMVVMRDEEAAAIRGQMSANLEKSTARVQNENDQVDSDWHDTWKLNYEDHPVVGWLVSEWSGDDTMELKEQYEPLTTHSRYQLLKYQQLKKKNASFKDQADVIAEAAKAGAEGRIIYDEGVGRQIEYAGKWVGALSKVKAAGQLAANIAAPGLGGAVYAGGEEALVQGVEIHYGQRESFDFGAIAIDAVSNYVAGKVTTGILGLPGKSAGLALRAGTWVAADRAGSTVGALTHMGLEQATGRADYSASDYFQTAKREATDVKQTIVNAVVGGVAHYAHDRPGRAGGEESRRTAPREEPKPVEEAKPKVDESKPVEQPRPTEEAKPKVDEAKPVEQPKPTEEAKPKVDEAKPSEQAKPAEEAKPKVDQASGGAKRKGKGKASQTGSEPAKRSKTSKKRRAKPKSARKPDVGSRGEKVGDIDTRLEALDVPSGERKQFEMAAKVVREKAAKNPAEAERLLELLEDRYAARETSAMAEDLDDPKRQPGPEKGSSGVHRHSTAAEDRALRDQSTPHPKRIRQDRNKESEKLGEEGGRKHAEREGITITEWDTPQQWKGLFGRGIDRIGLRGAKTILLEWKYGGSRLGISRRGTVQMSNEWVGRKIAELEMVGDVETAHKLLAALDEGNLQGAVYKTRPLKRGETTSRMRSSQLRDRLGNESISESGLITYSPAKVRAAYEARRADIVDAIWHDDWSVLKDL